MNEFVTVPPTVTNSDLLTRIVLPEDPASQQTEEIRKTIDKPLYEEDKRKIRKAAAPKRIAFALGKESDPDALFASGTFV